MSLRARVQNTLLATYKAANRSGLLDAPVAARMFQRAYFTYKRLVEDPFARLVKTRPELFRGGHVIDVGANIGYTAALFATAIAAPYLVHAFEPEARNFRWLEQTIDRGGLGTRIVAYRAAVGAREGAIDLWHNAAHHGDHRIAIGRLQDEPTQRVPLTTIDAHVMRAGSPPIAFVKIDVQGYEPEVLRGMHETIARNPGLHIAVELMPSALAELGFDAAQFLAELTAVLPRAAILERDGRLSAADGDAIFAAIRRSGVGYVDLISTRS